MMFSLIGYSFRRLFVDWIWFSLVGPIFLIFQPSKKIIKKSTPQKKFGGTMLGNFMICSINSEPFWANSGTPLASFSKIFLVPILLCFLGCFLKQISNTRKILKVLKTLHLRIDLGGRLVETIARSFENMHRFFQRVFTKHR